jgi:hypothetical protein
LRGIHFKITKDSFRCTADRQSENLIPKFE